MTESGYAVESDYDSFSADDYLHEYYSEIGEENRFLMDFHAWCCHAIAGSSDAAEQRLVLADIGGGPTIYQLISAAKLVDEIHVYEYSQANRERVQYWLSNHGDAFWDAYFYEGLARENDRQNGGETKMLVPSHAVETRKAELRAKLTRCSPCDLMNATAIAQREMPETGYPIVSSSFCVEAISDKRDIFMRAVDGVISLCAEQAYLVLTMVKNSSYYRSGNRYYPAYPVDENAMKEVLEAKGFELVGVAAVDAEPLDRGYEALFGILARRGQGRGGYPGPVGDPETP